MPNEAGPNRYSLPVPENSQTPSRCKTISAVTDTGGLKVPLPSTTSPLPPPSSHPHRVTIAGSDGHSFLSRQSKAA